MAGERHGQGHTQLLPEIALCWCLFTIPLLGMLFFPFNHTEFLIPGCGNLPTNKVKFLTSRNIHLQDHSRQLVAFQRNNVWF